MPRAKSSKPASPKDQKATPAPPAQSQPPGASLVLAYEGIIAAAMDAIIVVDEGQVVVLFNEAAEQMFRCPAQAALGKPLDQFIPSRFREAHHGYVGAFGKSGRTRRMMGHLGELTGLRPNGEEFAVEVAISHTTVGGKKYFTAFVRDITERRQHEQNLSRLAALVESSEDAIISKNLDGVITSWNRAAERLFGYTAAEAIGRPVFIIIPSERREEELRILARLKQGEHIKHFETQRRRKNGTLVAVSLSISPIHDAAGKVIGASKIVRDITERLRQDESLRLFRALVDRANDSFEIIDPETARFLDMTEQGCRELGYTREEILQLRVFDIDPSVKKEAWPGMMKRLRQNGADCLESFHVRKDGTSFPVEVNIRWVRLDRDYVLADVRDITERKRTENALRLFRELVDKSNDAFEVIDPETARFLDVNEKAHADIGYTRAEMLERTVFDVDPTMTQEMWSKLMHKARMEGFYFFEGRHIRRDGTSFPMEVNVKWVRLDRDYVVSIVRDISERKQAEEKLHFQDELLRETGHLAKVGGWHFDPATGQGAWTEQTARIFEADPAKPVTVEKGLAFYIGESQKKITDAVHAAITEAMPYDLELEILTESGQRKWVRTIGRPVVENGRVVQVRGSLQDITERKQAEQTLHERQEQLSLFIEHSPAALAMLDHDLRYLAVSRRWLQDFRIGNQDLLGRSHYDVFPLIPDRWKEVHRRCLAGAVERCEEDVMEQADGTRQIIRWEIRPWHTVDKKVGGIVIFTEDITARKQQEATLRESEERFREIAENIHEVFWITNAEMNEMYYVSPAYEKIWGRTCASLYANPHDWVDAIHPEDRARVAQAAFAQGTVGRYDEVYRITQPDGKVRWIHDRGFPIRDAAGQVCRIVGIAEDITQQRKLEEQFRQAQKMEAIGTLAGGIAHDFNNILAAINGYTELIKMKAGADSPLQDYLNAVSQAGTRATALVRQILTFSRQQEQQRRPVRLCDLVDESLKLLRATIPATIEFAISKQPDVPLVLADPTQIHQVLMNLGTNAWHAMRDTNGRLEVKVENVQVDAHFAEMRPRLRMGPYVRVAIADTGCGMDDATLARIFEPFFTTKPKGEGTGLGLAVVHGIMESHDGVVTVYSKPGQGTIFHLYFPAYAGQAGAPAAPTGPTPLGHGSHVLYVDDEEPLARLGQETLRQLGYEVEMTTKVTEALEWVRANPQRFDLIITDQTMPGMTGTDFAVQVLKIRPGLPIILTTGYSPYLTTEHVRTLGIRELLLKPHTIHSLGVAVNHALTSGVSSPGEK